MPDISTELMFNTARSGGKGGQNVNKVETMVEAYWHIESSKLVSEDEKKLISEKLAAKINVNGYLQVRSQTERSQLNNKSLAIDKINALVAKALVVQKKRKPTRPTAASKLDRINTKKSVGELKESRKKIKIVDS